MWGPEKLSGTISKVRIHRWSDGAMWASGWRRYLGHSRRQRGAPPQTGAGCVPVPVIGIFPRAPSDIPCPSEIPRVLPLACRLTSRGALGTGWFSPESVPGVSLLSPSSSNRCSWKASLEGHLAGVRDAPAVWVDTWAQGAEGSVPWEDAALGAGSLPRSVASVPFGSVLRCSGSCRPSRCGAGGAGAWGVGGGGRARHASALPLPVSWVLRWGLGPASHLAPSWVPRAGVKC